MIDVFDVMLETLRKKGVLFIELPPDIREDILYKCDLLQKEIESKCATVLEKLGK